eukprot:gene12732-3457_t
MSVASPRLHSAIERPPSKNGVALPMIKVAHPSSRIDDPATINVRGVSRQSNTRFGDDLQQNSPTVLRSITADQMPFRSLRSPRHSALPPLGENQEIKVTDDRNKTTIPILGKSADMSSPRNSRPSTSTTIATGRVSTDELERTLREKMKTGYFTIKNAFKSYDPEGKGNVDRESLSRIISNFVGLIINLSQFNKLMTRDFTQRCRAGNSPRGDSNEYPTWLELQRKAKTTMNASQVYMHLKEKAKQRFEDMAAIVPQKNPGGTKRILKPEFRNAISVLGFHMEDDEYDKLWTRFDTENVGAVNGEKILTKLGISITENNRPRTSQSSTKSRRSISPENIDDEKESFDIEKWMTNKFREGAREMLHAFYEMDLERRGLVSKAQLKRVLADYNIELDDQQLSELLERCNLSSTGMIDYKKFIQRYQDRSESGMAHKILNDPNHKYNNDMYENEALKDTVTAESKLMELFQTQFLSLLGSFHKLDRDNTMKLSDKQFRAVIESKFKIELSEEVFKSLLKKVPVDDNGMVKYVEFMSNFDSREAKSLFDAKSTVADLRDVNDIVDEIPPPTPREEKSNSRRASKDSYDSQEGRSVEELYSLIRGVVKQNYQEIEREFQELDELNSKKLNPDLLIKLLRKFGLNLSKNEVKRLWDTLITDHKGYLEFMQFVRHFSFRLKSAAFPNSKISPPKRGDSDFKLRSKKLNSAYDMIEDNLRSKVDQHWEALQKHFHDIDTLKTGFVTKEQFQNILQSLCIYLTDFECDVLSKKFDIQKNGSVCWVEFLKPFSSRRQVYRKGNNMTNILTHPAKDLINVSPRASKGFASVAQKIHNRFSGDLKQLQRAFKKLDKDAHGYLAVQEFTLVLKLCDVDIDPEENFQMLTELDKGMNGRVNYLEFLRKLGSL